MGGGEGVHVLIGYVRDLACLRSKALDDFFDICRRVLFLYHESVTGLRYV